MPDGVILREETDGRRFRRMSDLGDVGLLRRCAGWGVRRRRQGLLLRRLPGPVEPVRDGRNKLDGQGDSGCKWKVLDVLAALSLGGWEHGRPQRYPKRKLRLGMKLPSRVAQLERNRFKRDLGQPRWRPVVDPRRLLRRCEHLRSDDCRAGRLVGRLSRVRRRGGQIDFAPKEMDDPRNDILDVRTRFSSLFLPGSLTARRLFVRGT